MNTLKNAYTADELKLLRAAVAHAKANPSDSYLEVQRVAYGFKTNLEDYSESITETAEKARWEAALKSLVSQGLLRDVGAGNQSWMYAVTDQGFAANTG